MKLITAFFLFSSVLLSCKSGCAPYEAAEDKLNYESIIDATGNVTVKVGDSTKVYNHATIVYSLTDAATLLLKTKEGKYVYIQGPAIIELDKLNANP